MTMTDHRTTFALDQDTAQRLRRLAGLWRVSQAEVVRRAVAMAAERAEKPVDPAAGLRDLRRGGRLLVRETAEGYLAELAADRGDWRASS